MKSTKVTQSKRAASKAVRDPVEEFLALPDDEKERIWESYNRAVPLSQTRPLNAVERKQWARMRQKTGRATNSEPAKAVRVTIEEKLLRRADRYAEAAGFTRSQIFAKGLEVLLSGGDK
jgi:hypothetical protein